MTSATRRTRRPEPHRVQRDRSRGTPPTGASGRAPFFRDRRTALVLGYGGILLGAVCLWDAYEQRGRQRPFLVKFLPGG